MKNNVSIALILILTVFLSRCDLFFPTGNSNNSQSQKVETPIILPGSGEYASPQTITITCETEGASVYYTLEGTVPTENSNKYEAPFIITESTTIKAVGVKDGYDNSETVTVTIRYGNGYLLTSFQAPPDTSYLSFDGNNLITVDSTNMLYKIDPQNGTIADSVQIDPTISISGISHNGQVLFVLDTSGNEYSIRHMYQVDPCTGDILKDTQLDRTSQWGSYYYNCLAYDGTHLNYFVDYDADLRFITEQPGSINAWGEYIEYSTQNESYLSSLVDICHDGSNLWAIRTSSLDRVIAITPSIITETINVTIGSSFKGITREGDTIWINASDGRLYKLLANESASKTYLAPLEESVPQSITVSSDKDFLNADGEDTVTLHAIVYNQYGYEMEGIVDYYVNDTLLSNNMFSTNVPGAYVFYAKVGTLQSNTVEIQAQRPWEVVGTVDIEGVKHVKLSVDNNIPYIAYSDQTKDNRVTVRKYNGSELELVGNAGFSRSVNHHIGYTDDTDLAFDVSEGVPYISYIAVSLYDYLCEVMKYDQSNGWVDLSYRTSAYTSEDDIESVSITVNEGIPYVSVYESDVKRVFTESFVNGQWISVGSYTSGSFYTNLYNAINFDDGNIYRTFVTTDWNSDCKAQFQYHNGTDWSFISQHYATHRDNEVDDIQSTVKNGTLYAALVEYTDYNYKYLSVCKYENGSWEIVGDSKFLLVDKYDSNPHIFKTQDSLYCSVLDAQKKPKIVQFNGTEWIEVGNHNCIYTEFSTISSFSADIAQDGTLYIAFTDSDNYNKVTVMKYMSVP